jgi:prepilin-type processing-associated H-X9-DG protein
VLLCPSDSAVGRSYKSSFTGSREFAKGNYAAYASPEHVTCLEIVPGALIWQGQPLSRVEDGTSNTIMLAEIRTREDVRDVRGAWALAWVGASVLGADVHTLWPGNPTKLLRICGEDNPPTYQPNPSLAPYALMPNAPVPDKPEGARDDIRQCFDSANADLEGMPCNGTNSATKDSFTAATRSLHPGGVNAVHVDGSVVWLNDSIDPVVFGASIGINEGVVVTQ